MKNIRYFISLLFFLFCVSASAQKFELPEQYNFDSPADYSTYNQEIQAAIDWMLNTPLEQEIDKRKKVNQFFFAWLSGTPEVEVMMSNEIITFMEPNAELLMIFFAGWAKDALERGVKDDHLAGNVAGIEAVINFYEKNRAHLKKDKNVERYKKLHEKDQLQNFISKRI